MKGKMMELVTNIRQIADNLHHGAGMHYSASRITEAADLLEEALKALEDIREDMERLAEPCIGDAAALSHVLQLGERIGYGNLMVTASALWRQTLALQGVAGGEFSPNICQATAAAGLKRIDAILTKSRGEKIDG